MISQDFTKNGAKISYLWRNKRLIEIRKNIAEKGTPGIQEHIIIRNMWIELEYFWKSVTNQRLIEEQDTLNQKCNMYALYKYVTET